MIKANTVILGGFPGNKDNLTERDAAGRFRTSAAFGIFDNKNTTSRNRNQWEEIISGFKIEYDTLVGGPFQVGEDIRGTGELVPIMTITADSGAVLTCNGNHNDFTDGMTITGQISGATAVIVSTNTGSDIRHDFNLASVIIQAGEGATDYAIRQTHRYFAYIPGKGQDPIITFLFGAPELNRVRRAGYFDDNDGLLIEQTFDDVAMVVRSSTSGSPVDTRYIQADWNIDKLDGKGPSGAILDLTKAQLVAVPFLWQGVASVKFGLEIGNKLIYVHEVETANVSEVVYMRNPSLPIRYEIRNTGAVTGTASMNEICTSISSEGGYILPGLEFSQSMGDATRAVTEGEPQPIFAIRLKGEFPAGKPNRRVVRFLNTSAFIQTRDVLITVCHIHDPIDIVASWNDVGGGSAVEYSRDITAVTGRPAHAIEHDYIPTGQANKGASQSLSSEFINKHGFISQDFNSSPDGSEMLVVYGQALVPGTANVLNHMTWIEFD